MQTSRFKFAWLNIIAYRRYSSRSNKQGQKIAGRSIYWSMFREHSAGISYRLACISSRIRNINRMVL